MTNHSPDEQITHIVLAQLVESKRNPRKKYHGIDELAHSIKSQGILQPLVVRQARNGYEIVCGHRRARAAKLAGLTHVPALIRVFASDDDVLAAQITENCIREDIHPLEEAQAYAKLKKTGRSVAQIASAVGKSESHIYKRLQLCTLSRKTRTAFMRGEIPAGVAYVLARMPSDALQDEALDAIQASARTEAATTRHVARYIEQNYMLRLSQAPFSRSDTTLLPEAGACTNCPKRTDNQPTLFDDIKQKSVCTDPACFHAKTQANWTRAAQKAVSHGMRVLSASEAKKVFRHGSEHVAPGSKYVDPKTPHPQDPDARPWHKLLGKAAPTAVLCLNPRGKSVKLYERKAAEKALRDVGITFKRPAVRAKADISREEQQHDERHQRQWVAHHASKAVLTQIAQRLVVRDLTIEVWHHVLSLVLDAYNGPNDKLFDNASEALNSHDKRTIQSAIASLILWQTTEDARFQGQRPTALETLAKIYDVDYDQAEQQAQDDLQRARQSTSHSS